MSVGRFVRRRLLNYAYRQAIYELAAVSRRSLTLYRVPSLLSGERIEGFADQSGRLYSGAVKRSSCLSCMVADGHRQLGRI